jgi:hypothetical protein
MKVGETDDADVHVTGEVEDVSNYEFSVQDWTVFLGALIERFGGDVSITREQASKLAGKGLMVTGMPDGTIRFRLVDRKLGDA